MAGTIKISTDRVEGIATDMENLNNKLNETLQECLQTVQSLNSTWTGEAATATIEGFESFANEYFETYDEVIKSYVSFLRLNVSSDYQATETENISLSDNFK